MKRHRLLEKKKRKYNKCREKYIEYSIEALERKLDMMIKW